MSYTCSVTNDMTDRARARRVRPRRDSGAPACAYGGAAEGQKPLPSRGRTVRTNGPTMTFPTRRALITSRGRGRAHRRRPRALGARADPTLRSLRGRETPAPERSAALSPRRASAIRSGGGDGVGRADRHLRHLLAVPGDLHPRRVRRRVVLGGMASSPRATRDRATRHRPHVVLRPRGLPTGPAPSTIDPTPSLVPSPSPHRTTTPPPTRPTFRSRPRWRWSCP